MTRCIAIDDDPLFLKLLSSYFSDFKSAELLNTYTNPVEGIMAVVKQKPDVLLLDMDMPYLDGLEALETLDKHPRVIVISGNTRLDPSSFNVDTFISKSNLTSGELLERSIQDVMAVTP